MSGKIALIGVLIVVRRHRRLSADRMPVRIPQRQRKCLQGQPEGEPQSFSVHADIHRRDSAWPGP